MLADAELAQDFTILTQQYRELIDSLLGVVGMPGHADGSGDPPGREIFAALTATSSMWCSADPSTPAIRAKPYTRWKKATSCCRISPAAPNQDSAVYYRSEVGARLHSYPALEFMRRVFSEPAAMRLWSRLLVTYAGLMLRIAAAHVPEEAPATPGYEDYAPGDIIIRQGDRADYVFNMSSGVAEVLVDDVTVGRIGEGEIFGAMAALTHADRSATVRAKTACSVVKVPKEQFTELIKSNPATIHSLLIDMANSIVNLNEQLVGLRGSHGVN